MSRKGCRAEKSRRVDLNAGAESRRVDLTARAISLFWSTRQKQPISLDGLTWPPKPICVDRLTWLPEQTSLELTQPSELRSLERSTQGQVRVRVRSLYGFSPIYGNFLKTIQKHCGHMMEFEVDIPNVIILAKPLYHEDIDFYFW